MHGRNPAWACTCSSWDSRRMFKKKKNYINVNAKTDKTIKIKKKNEIVESGAKATRKLFPTSVKQFPSDTTVKRVIFVCLLPPYELISKYPSPPLPPLHHSAVTSSISGWEMSRLAPLPVWWCSKPDRRGDRAFGSTGGGGGWKSENRDILRQVSGAGSCDHTLLGRVAAGGAVGHRVGVAVDALTSTLLHSALWWDRKKKKKAKARYFTQRRQEICTKHVPASSSGSNRLGLGPSVLSCSCLMWRTTAVAL